MPGFKHVKPGDPLSIPAADYNGAMDAARAHASGRFGGGPLASTKNTTIILVQNNSGEDVGERGILELGPPLIAPSIKEDEFKSKIAFSGTSPTAAAGNGRIAIAIDPIKDGQIGKAIIAGVVTCKINAPSEMPAAQITGAQIEADETAHLTAASGGPVQVLWIEDPPVAEEGKETPAATERWATVKLDNAGPFVTVSLSGAKEDEPGTYIGSFVDEALGDTTIQCLVTNWGERLRGWDLLGVFGTDRMVGRVVGWMPADDEDYPSWPLVHVTYDASSHIRRGRIMVDWDPSDNFVYVKAGVDLLSEGEFTNPTETIPDHPHGLTYAVKVFLRSAVSDAAASKDVDPLESPSSALAPGLDHLTLKRNVLISYIHLVEPSAFEYLSPSSPETSAERLLAHAMPATKPQIFLRVTADHVPGENYVQGKLQDAEGVDLGGKEVTCYLTSDTGNAPVFSDIATDDVLLVDASGPDEVHAVNALVTNGKVSVNESDAPDYLTNQLTEGPFITLTTKTGPDKTSVIEVGHVVQKSPIEVPTLTFKDGTVYGAIFTFDEGRHFDKSDPDEGAPLLGIYGDEIWIHIETTPATESEPAKLTIEHINEATGTAITPTGASQDEETEVISLTFPMFDVDDNGHVLNVTSNAVELVGDGTWILPTYEAGKDGTSVGFKHAGPGTSDDVYAFLSVDYKDGVLSFLNDGLGVDQWGHAVEQSDLGTLFTLEGDGTWTEIADGGKGNFLVNHIGPGSAGVDSYPNLSLSADSKNLTVTWDGVLFDEKGHLAGTEEANTANLSLVEVTVVTDVQVSGTTLQKKTRTIYVPYAGSESSWTTWHTGTSCA